MFTFLKNLAALFSSGAAALPPKSGESGRADQQPNKLSVVFVGEKGSGKSTLIGEFVDLATSDGGICGVTMGNLSPNLLPQRDTDGYPPGTTNAVTIVPVAIQVNHQEFQLFLTDTLGTQFKEAQRPDLPATATVPQPTNTTGDLYGIGAAADLIVLVVPSEAFEEEANPPLKATINRFVSFVKYATEQNPDAMVAIAYAKSDEYGVNGSIAGRLLNTNEQRHALGEMRRVLNNANADTGVKDRAWDTFVKSVSTASRVPAITAGLLERTRQLWISVIGIGNVPPKNINSYLIAALPAELELRNLSRRGLTAMFCDFFGRVRETRLRPRLPARAAIVGLLVALGAMAASFSYKHSVDTHARALEESGFGRFDVKLFTPQDLYGVYPTTNRAVIRLSPSSNPGPGQIDLPTRAPTAEAASGLARFLVAVEMNQALQFPQRITNLPLPRWDALIQHRVTNLRQVVNSINNDTSRFKELDRGKGTGIQSTLDSLEQLILLLKNPEKMLDATSDAAGVTGLTDLVPPAGEVLNPDLHWRYVSQTLKQSPSTLFRYQSALRDCDSVPEALYKRANPYSAKFQGYDPGDFGTLLGMTNTSHPYHVVDNVHSPLYAILIFRMENPNTKLGEAYCAKFDNSNDIPKITQLNKDKPLPALLKDLDWLAGVPQLPSNLNTYEYKDFLLAIEKTPTSGYRRVQFDVGLPETEPLAWSQIVASRQVRQLLDSGSTPPMSRLKPVQFSDDSGALVQGVERDALLRNLKGFLRWCRDNCNEPKPIPNP